MALYAIDRTNFGEKLLPLPTWETTSDGRLAAENRLFDRLDFLRLSRDIPNYLPRYRLLAGTTSYGLLKSRISVRVAVVKYL